jgi:acyl-coenzyme A synthetase/AMP-(fatty) acid ligase
MPAGSASTRKSAFVVIKKGANASEDEVRDFVRDNLGPLQGARDVLLLDGLPRDATGKVLKRELVKH